MALVGQHDLPGRSAYQLVIQEQDGRWLSAAGKWTSTGSEHLMTLLVRTAGNSFPMEVSWRFFNLAQPIVEFEENRPQGDIATLQIRLLIYACASQKACFYAAFGLTLEMDCHEFIFPPFSMPKFEAVLGHLKLATTSFGRDPE